MAMRHENPGRAANFCKGTKVGWTAGFSWRIGFRRTERFGAAELLSGDLLYRGEPDVLKTLELREVSLFLTLHQFTC